MTQLTAPSSSINSTPLVSKTYLSFHSHSPSTPSPPFFSTFYRGSPKALPFNPFYSLYKPHCPVLSIDLSRFDLDVVIRNGYLPTKGCEYNMETAWILRGLWWIPSVQLLRLLLITAKLMTSQWGTWGQENKRTSFVVSGWKYLTLSTSSLFPLHLIKCMSIFNYLCFSWPIYN